MNDGAFRRAKALRFHGTGFFRILKELGSIEKVKNQDFSAVCSGAPLQNGFGMGVIGVSLSDVTGLLASNDWRRSL